MWYLLERASGFTRQPLPSNQKISDPADLRLDWGSTSPAVRCPWNVATSASVPLMRGVANVHSTRTCP